MLFAILGLGLGLGYLMLSGGLFAIINAITGLIFGVRG